MQTALSQARTDYVTIDYIIILCLLKTIHSCVSPTGGDDGSRPRSQLGEHTTRIMTIADGNTNEAPWQVVRELVNKDSVLYENAELCLTVSPNQTCSKTDACSRERKPFDAFQEPRNI